MEQKFIVVRVLIGFKGWARKDFKFRIEKKKAYAVFFEVCIAKQISQKQLMYYYFKGLMFVRKIEDKYK